MSEDCYIFVDPDPNVREEDRTMKFICVECRDEHMPDTGSYYPGSREGYGPFNFICCKCGKFIHRADEDDDEDTNEEVQATHQNPRW